MIYLTSDPTEGSYHPGYAPKWFSPKVNGPVAVHENVREELGPRRWGYCEMVAPQIHHEKREPWIRHETTGPLIHHEREGE